MNSSHTSAVLDTAELGAEETSPKPKKPEEKTWPYIHAPDALSARSVSVPRRGLRRELKIFLTNPNAIVGLLFLATVAGLATALVVLFREIERSEKAQRIRVSLSRLIDPRER